MTESVNTSDSLRNLKEWQACSHPGLAGRKPEELFEEDFAERYKRLHKDIYQRIVRMHGTLYTLERLKEFPFDYLYAPNGMEFWRLVVENFLDMACIMLHGLVKDQDPDAHTIPKFRNDIMKGPWRDPTKRDLLQQTLREREFDKIVDSIANRVREIRNHRIAHRFVDWQSGHLKDQLGAVSLGELRQLFDAAHSLFGALSFGGAYVTCAGDLMPATVGGKRRRTCLDEVLDAVLRDSNFVNKPERRAQWWPREREHMDPGRRQVMNDLRRCIGLPEA